MPVITQKIRDIDNAGAFTEHPDHDVEYNWSDLLWGALSVGRRSIYDVFAHGHFSLMELIWRCAMIKANISTLPRNGRTPSRFVTTAAFESLDGSEKSAVTYFLGLILAKLAAERRLNVPWLWHLDVYSTENLYQGPPTRIVAASNTDSRPDLIGQSVAGSWLVCEAKGRSRSVTNELRCKAKDQTRKISFIDGALPAWRFASIARFSGKVLTQEWIDPEGWSEDAQLLGFSELRLFEQYYGPVLAFLSPDVPGLSPARSRTYGERAYLGREIPGVDVWLGLDERLLYDWAFDPIAYIESVLGVDTLRKEASEREPPTQPGVTIGKDGIVVEVGAQWK